MMYVLRDVLQEAQEKGVAIGHFNLTDLVLLKAVFTSAQELKVPVIAGASDSEREFMASVKSLCWCEEENVRQTKEAVEALKAINPSILVEGEVGDIGTGSEIKENAPDLSKGLTTPEEAKQFIESTGIDILAPAVGNMHGILKSKGWCRARRGSAWISKESVRSNEWRASC